MSGLRAFHIFRLLGEAMDRAETLAESSDMPAIASDLIDALADLEHELNALFEPPRGADDAAERRSD